MILFLLGSLVVWLSGGTDPLLWLLLCATVLGGALLLTARGSSRPKFRRVIGGLVIEELLFLAPMGALEPGAYGDRGHLAACLVSSALAAALLLRLPLPEQLFPVRRGWLRKLLAPLTLVGLVYAGPWSQVWEMWWGLRLPAWPILPGLLVALGLLSLGNELLVTGCPLPALAAERRERDALRL